MKNDGDDIKRLPETLREAITSWKRMNWLKLFLVKNLHPYILRLRKQSGRNI